MKGWISVHRKITENWLWQDKPFAKGQAWIDLLLLVNREETEKPYKGQIKKYAPGTVNVSITYLANRWGWTWRRTKRFIKLLESAEMVTANVTTNDTTITIANWAFYQGEGRTRDTKQQSEGQSEGQSEEHRNNNINNSNKGIRGSARPSEEEAFEEMLESWYQEAKAKEDADRGIQENNSAVSFSGV